MFIGREQELNTLNKLYHSDKFEFETSNYVGGYTAT